MNVSVWDGGGAVVNTLSLFGFVGRYNLQGFVLNFISSFIQKKIRLQKGRSHVRGLSALGGPLAGTRPGHALQGHRDQILPAMSEYSGEGDGENDGIAVIYFFKTPIEGWGQREICEIMLDRNANRRTKIKAACSR